MSIADFRICGDKQRAVVGLYGIPGCGKSYLLKELKVLLADKRWAFFEGSEVLNDVTPGGLEAFKTLNATDKTQYRTLAIEKIKQECENRDRAGLVTGHFSFWEDPWTRSEPETVWTKADAAVYSHIIYLKSPGAEILRFRGQDQKRRRTLHAEKHYDTWQSLERENLGEVCLLNEILLAVFEGKTNLIDKVGTLLENFRRLDDRANFARAAMRLNDIIDHHVVRSSLPEEPVNHVLILDGDKTLISQDTGAMFWERVYPETRDDPVTKLFQRWNYTLNAFRQARLMYDEIREAGRFEEICDHVASHVKVHPDFKRLICVAKGIPNIVCVVVTCGVREVWESIMRKEGLNIKVLGAGPDFGGFVVTGDVKRDIVVDVKALYKAHVTAFGDSSLDLKMLEAANTAVVVVGEEAVRSRQMEPALDEAIKQGLKAHQVLLPPTVRPRLDTKRLPILDLSDPAAITAILDCHRLPASLKRQNNVFFTQDELSFALLDATDRSSAKLLATPTRNANISGPELRKAHAAIGQYLATEFISAIVGLEEYDIPHVQGNTTTGHRLLHESATLIVPILRGGEPMAFGVSEAFPRAMFVHAKEASDLKSYHVKDMKNIILVDSVVNTGKSVVEFVERLRELDATAEHVVFVAGVVQSGAVAGDGLVATMVKDGKGCNGKLSVIALRLSHNKFTGQGTTDTGNRLFNTTHLN